ncbi:hypothetical protein JHK84_050506 [Glycine max]|nr:hypothetical protein JHK84_050506 [Glycine max]
MANKPNTIPPEKEDILQESLSRIKCIEYDLQKTKKALLATASKQVELAESLESLKESKFDHTLHEGNQCADVLAKLGANSLSPLDALHDPPVAGRSTEGCLPKAVIHF